MTSIIKVDQIQTAAGGVPTVKDLGLEAGSVLQCKAQTRTIGNTGTGADIETVSVAASGIENAYSLNTVTITPKYSDSLILMQWSGMVMIAGSSAGGLDLFFTKDDTNLLTYGGNRDAAGFVYSNISQDLYSMASSQYSFTSGQTTPMTLAVKFAAYSTGKQARAAHDGTTTLTVWEIAQ